MKKVFLGLILGLFSLTFLSWAKPGLAQDISIAPPTGFINDRANIISEPTQQELEAKLENFKSETGHEIAVLTLGSLQGLSIETLAVEVFEDWGIGKAGQDNGLLLLIALSERKVKIEVGYGLEPYITDAEAGRIIRNVIAPEFKKQNYESGINQAIDRLIFEAKGLQSQSNNRSGFSGSPKITLIFIAINLVFVYTGAFLARSKSFHAGGILGGVVGLVLTILIDWAFGVFLIVGFAGLGLFLDWLFSKNYKTRKKKGRPTSWWSSGGGFSSGSSSGGGFGGFGGGSSGGGGASGGW